MARKAAAATAKQSSGTDNEASGGATVELAPGNRHANDDQPTEQANSSALDAYLSLGGNENRDAVTVFKTNETGTLVFLFSVDPVEVGPDALMQRLRQQHGPGEYRLQVRKGGRISENKRIAVEAEPVPRGDRDADRRERTAGEPDFYTRMLMQQAQEAQKAQTQLLTALIGRPAEQRQGMDVAKVLTAVAPLALPVITGMVDMMKGTKPDMLEMAQKLADLKDALGGGETASRGAAGVWDMLTEVAKGAAPMLARIVMQPRPPAPNGAQVQQPAPAAIAAPAGEVHVTKPEPVAPVVAQQLGDGHPLMTLLTLLINAAVKDSDPEDYVQVTIDLWPEEIGHQGLYALLNAPDWLHRLAQFEPKVAAQGPWFEKLRTELLEAFKPDDDAEATAGGDAD